VWWCWHRGRLRHPRQGQPLTYCLILLLTHALIHPLTYLLTLLPTYLISYSSTHSLTYSLSLTSLQAGISTVPNSVITGNIGVSPIAATAMTGFSLTLVSSTQHSTSAQVTGNCYGASYGGATASALTIAVLDMEAAYTDAAGRPVRTANLNVKSGLISGETFTAGVYKWGSDVYFSSDIYITGTATDIFIFQCTNNVIAGSGAKVILQGGALASNIVWQMAGFVVAGPGSHLEGIFLVKTKAVFEHGSSLNGRILAQTATTLDMVTITEPRRLSAKRSLRGV
jgi:hypothetical protein